MSVVLAVVTNLELHIQHGDNPLKEGLKIVFIALEGSTKPGLSVAQQPDH